MENSVLISVIMCVYNTEKPVFYHAIQSILTQTYQNFELIIVNDGSKVLYDDFPFNDKRIIWINNERNAGISFSRNQGLSIAKGKYIAIMDSDDFAFPSRLEKEVDFLEKNQNVVACGTWFKFIGAKNHEVKRILDDNEYYRCCLFFGNSPTLLDPSSMIRKSVLDNNNIKYDENLKIGMDYLMWIQLSEIGVVTNVKEVLMNYRVHNNQITKSPEYYNFERFNYFLTFLQKKVGCFLSKEETMVIIESNSKKGINLILLIDTIEKIKNANKKTKYYDLEKFRIRCDEQIRRTILKNKNFFWKLKYFFNKKTIRLIIKTDLSRVFRR